MHFFIWVFIFLLTFARVFLSRPPDYSGRRVRVSGTVYQEPTKYSSSQKISLTNFNFYLPLYPEIHYGDRVVVEGLVDENNLKNVSLINVRERQHFFNIREKLVGFYQQSLPEPHASLMAGITFGAKSTLEENFWEKLKSTGTLHVVVASGMNVTMLAGFLLGVFTLVLPRKKVVPLILLGIWVYVLIIGFEAPIVRAAIMASIAFTAQALGRLYSAWRGLTISALLMLIVQPQWLDDLGFILSFVSTLALLLFSQRIDRLIKFIPGILREGIATSLAAQIGVSPILFVTFGQFNILSPLVNGLVLWIVPYVMVLGMSAAVVGFLIPLLGKLLLFLSYPLTSWFIFVVNIFGK
jgi:competence protein ComEC